MASIATMWLPRFLRRSRADAESPAAPPPAGESPSTPRADAWQPTPREDLGWRVDAWQDPSTGLGTERDGRLWATFVADLVTARQAAELVRGDGLAAKLVEDIVDEAFRIGFDLEIKERTQTRGSDGAVEAVDERPAEQLEADVRAAWVSLGVLEKLALAEKMDRQDGGAAILLGLTDLRTTPDRPPAKNAKLEWLRVVHPSRLRPHQRYSDPYSAKCGEVELWHLLPETKAGMSASTSEPILVHEERLIILDGVHTAGDVYTFYEFEGFGDSILTRAKAAVRRFYAALDGIEITARRNGEPWWKVKDLPRLLATDGGKGFQTRLAAKERARSTLKTNVIDSEDDYGMAAAPLTGLREVVETFKDELVAITGMPRARLFGESPGGIGDNSKGPQRVWYDYVAAWAKVKAVPPLVRITTRLMNGLGGTPYDWTITPTDPWQMSDKERAEINKLDAETDVALVTAAIITPRQAASREEWQLRYKLEAVDDMSEADIPDDIRDPNADPATEPNAGGGDIQKTALNGAQIASLLEVVRAVAAGEIPRATGIAIVLASFPNSFDASSAESVMPQEGFAPPPPPPAPFGDGPPGSPPGAGSEIAGKFADAAARKAAEGESKPKKPGKKPPAGETPP